MSGLYEHIRWDLIGQHAYDPDLKDVNNFADSNIYKELFFVNVGGDVLFRRSIIKDNDADYYDVMSRSMVKIKNLPPMIQVHSLIDNSDYKLTMLTTDHDLMLLDENHDVERLDIGKIRTFSFLCNELYVIDINDNVRHYSFRHKRISSAIVENARWIDASLDNYRYPIVVTNDNQIVTAFVSDFYHQSPRLIRYQIDMGVKTMCRNNILLENNQILKIGHGGINYRFTKSIILNHDVKHLHYAGGIIRTIDHEGTLRAINESRIEDNRTYEGKFNRFIRYRNSALIEDIDGVLKSIVTLKSLGFPGRIIDLNNMAMPIKSSRTKI